MTRKKKAKPADSKAGFGGKKLMGGLAARLGKK